MDAVAKAYQTQLGNIQTKTGKTLDQLYALARQSGLARHGEILALYKRELGIGHGDANTLTKFYLLQAGGKGAAVGEAAAPGKNAAGKTKGANDPLDEIYAGSKAELRPVHDRVMAAIGKLGPFEISPKKTYLSLRRKKQFATVGPGTKGRLEIGLNMKGVPGTPRLTVLPAGGMCQYKVYVANGKEVDKELLGWIKQAYDSAG